MLVFPQLTTGASVTFPVTMTHHERSIVNEMLGGGTIRSGDRAASRRRWTLDFDGLTFEECVRINELHERVEGRLDTFVFLDPTANLLRWSDDFSRGVWAKDPLLQVQLNRADPFGGTQAALLSNGSSTSQALAQTLAAPGDVFFSFSFYGRSTSSHEILARRESGGVSEERTFSTTSQWKRFYTAGRLASDAESVRFSLEIGPGVVVEIAGIQVEAQLNPGPYRRSEDRGGVVARARFESDAIVFRASGPSQYQSTLEIVEVD